MSAGIVPLARSVCFPLMVAGRDRVPDEPVLFVANHASHADTVAIIAALPPRVRARIAPAAAEDYFFKSRLRGRVCRWLTGAFPFPRHGAEGLRRARALLASGRAVLIYPEGTRSRTGAIAAFRPGAAILASQAGATVVPVGIAGTGDVLPVHGRLPRRAPVAVVFGEPQRFAPGDDTKHVTECLERSVEALAQQARALRPRTRRTVYARANAIASGPAGVALAFGWGVAEALVWPVVPDFAIAMLAAAAPRRFWRFVVAALAGSMLGGAVAYALGTFAGATVVAHLPLVTPRMQHAAAQWLREDGGWALWHQFRFGVPYKTFAWQAAHNGTGVAQLETATFVVRGLRMLGVGVIFAGLALPWRRWADRLYGAFAVAFGVAFALALARIVAAWS
jgi:1-acyl-sn-glycerol-3-phosphate acyltransferase